MNPKMLKRVLNQHQGKTDETVKYSPAEEGKEGRTVKDTETQVESDSVLAPETKPDEISEIIKNPTESPKVKENTYNFSFSFSDSSTSNSDVSKDLLTVSRT